MSESPIVKVPVPEVTVAAYRAVFSRLGAVLEIGWLPLLILLGVSIVPAVLPVDFGADNTALRALPDFLDLVAGALCLNAFGVRWYQAQLFGHAGAAARPWVGPWGRFLLYTFVLYVVLGAAVASVFVLATAAQDRGLAIEIVSFLVDLAVAVALLFTMARLSLLFPAAAAGEPIGLRGAWRATRGNAWRIVLCWFFATAPLLIGVQIVMGAAFAGVGGGATRAPMGLFILRGLVGTVADFLIEALDAVVLAEFYRRLIEAAES
ncbi:MAG: hypothetical protein KGL11_01235 [Alphaproteobacteria bacterium]|nr:hypothetical protein [Alphaproteobacteria bacterium]